MKITYLRLKNFSAIETGMHKKTIEIDFSKCKNNIVLLVGLNGSGKTALLSTLHPFAYPGTMDIRANSAMIIKDCDGYKEIHYNHNSNIYEIIHHYKNSKKGLTVKSFIKKNGTELNPNGNVTSFNEIVYNELSIQSDFLKILRLGSNVTNLIEMKSSERKAFTMNLFSDLDVWMQLYKKVNEDNRTLKGLLVAVANKLQRLNITDKDALINHIKKLEEDEIRANDNINTLNMKLGTLQGIIQTKFPDGVDAFRESMKHDEDEINTILKDIKKINHDMDIICRDIVIVGDIDDAITYLDDRINTLRIKRASEQAYIENYNNTLNKLMNDLQDIQSKLNVTKSDNELKDLKALRDIIKSKINSVSDSIKNYEPVLTKNELLLAINVLHEIESIVLHTYEFGKDAVQKSIVLINDDINIDKFIGDKVAKLDKQIAEIKATSKTNTNDTFIMLYRPPTCDDDKCPYLDLYNRFFGKEDGEKPSIASLEHKRDFWINVSNAVSNLKNINSIIKTYSNIVNNLKTVGVDYFDIKKLYDRIYDDEPIFDETVLTKLINTVEEYNYYIECVSKLKDIELELSTIHSDTALLDSLRNSETQLKFEIDTVTKYLEKEKTELESTNSAIGDGEILMKKYKDYKELDDKSNELEAVTDDLADKLKSKKELYLSAKQHIDDIDLINEQISSQKKRLDDISKELFDARYRLKTYKTLMKERDILNTQFEEVAIINEALSPNKGIPLVYIQLYLESAKMFVNNILRTVYDNFEIAGFNINENEFTIPYIKNGVMISDVTSASQGERSFLSIAISFALINNSIKDYNIILLDEIDATLDTRNRAMFLNILMQMIDLIQSEQVFMITHNNMFDSYPVDVIMTGDVNLDNYKNANIIFKA